MTTRPTTEEIETAIGNLPKGDRAESLAAELMIWRAEANRARRQEAALAEVSRRLVEAHWNEDDLPTGAVRAIVREMETVLKKSEAGAAVKVG